MKEGQAPIFSRPKGWKGEGQRSRRGYSTDSFRRRGVQEDKGPVIEGNAGKHLLLRARPIILGNSKLWGVGASSCDSITVVRSDQSEDHGGGRNSLWRILDRKRVGKERPDRREVSIWKKKKKTGGQIAC